MLADHVSRMLSTKVPNSVPNSVNIVRSCQDFCLSKGRHLTCRCHKIYFNNCNKNIPLNESTINSFHMAVVNYTPSIRSMPKGYIVFICSSVRPSFHSFIRLSGYDSITKFYFEAF